MKLSFMKPLEKPRPGTRINPFEHDMTSMGQPIGTGRLTVMYGAHDYDYVYLVDTLTGARVKVELEKTINWRNIKGG